MTVTWRLWCLFIRFGEKYLALLQALCSMAMHEDVANSIQNKRNLSLKKQ